MGGTDRKWQQSEAQEAAGHTLRYKHCTPRISLGYQKFKSEVQAGYLNVLQEKRLSQHICPIAKYF
jgi:hypothetical protein